LRLDTDFLFCDAERGGEGKGIRPRRRGLSFVMSRGAVKLKEFVQDEENVLRMDTDSIL
jgi:hypothetical protein